MTAICQPVRRVLVVTVAAALLAACGGDDDKEKTGFLTVGVTDAPVDHAEEVVVKFTGVELKPRGGPAFSIDFPAPGRSIDLMDYQGTGRAVILDGAEIEAGEYEWLRLKVAADPTATGDSYVRLTATGQECEMRIPSGAETGLKLVRGFTVGVGAVTDLTVDFDLRKSVVAPPGQRTEMDTCDDTNQVYLLRPALRIVDNLQVGAISGTVDANLVAAQCASSNQAPYPGNVYLYGPLAAGQVITPDDYDGVASDPNGPDPVTSAMVSPTDFSYTIGFVPVGNYVVAYTCDLDGTTVDADAAGSTEVVDFTPPAGQPVAVTANQTTQGVNF